MGVRLVRASAARIRIAQARSWLAEQPPGRELLVVAASSDAAGDLLRRAASENGSAFGWHRATPDRLAAELAAPALASQRWVPVGALAAEAVAARALHALGERRELGRYAEVSEGPGFARALARVLTELRFARADPAGLARSAPELAALGQAYQDELVRAKLVDRARVWALAATAAADPGFRHPWLDRPTLWLDAPLESALEQALLGAVLARAPEVLLTLPAGDAAAAARLAALPGVEIEDLDEPDAGALGRLQRHLFGEELPTPKPGDEGVAVLSAPGESRECVEIARHMLRRAAQGVPFDEMAVLLRSPEAYRPHLEEAFDRAGIPAHFARGSLRPHPAGRAFLALLACAAEGLSARRFAEYLSLGEVPDAGADGAPPALTDPAWVAPDEELVPQAAALALAQVGSDDEGPGAPEDPAAPVVAGSLRAPRHWEKLLVDAAVIGGLERWQRRLDGLKAALLQDRGELDDPEGPEEARIRRDLDDLAALRDYALPLLRELDALPQSARWGGWLEALAALARRALRRPERVLAVLSELAPMAEVGPIALSEVRLVLERRLLELSVAPPASRYGRVFVAPAERARGMAFEVVFVPGLAERLFPQKILEEPLLLDALRAQLDAELDTNDSRRERERRALRLAVGAARSAVLLSYPRIDLDQGRPRVPSFYALEALRAAEGRLPGFEELRRRAEGDGGSRIGWPAPADPGQAIDEAEHDLALLQGLRGSGESPGAARYLLTANPHLGRALRFRARRWLRRWTRADGLVQPEEGADQMGEAALAAIAEHALSARSYSPTALQNFATCPYKFFLYAVHKLAPREAPEAIEEIDPLSRGSLVHEVQFELMGRLRRESLLPVRPGNLERARVLLDEVLDEVAARYREDLAPAIERVWEDGVTSVRADLREWLRRASLDASGFVPWRFELAFGLAGRRDRDEHSAPEPVDLDCGIRLRGSIDLVERRADGSDPGALRVTDHKTGRNRVAPGSVVAGGESLQPVLYALAVEKLVPEARVESGRLFYCTAAGGFEEVEVPLDARARDSAKVVAQSIGEGLAGPFLPAAPLERACQWCDYRPVCGPYEWRRSSQKPPERLASLRRLRELP